MNRTTTFHHRGWEITIDIDDDAGPWRAVRGSLMLRGHQRPHLNPPYREALTEIDRMEIPERPAPVDRSDPYEGVL